jgi:starch synthase
MRVLFAAAEMSPYAKTGGLGDVVGSLPKALRQHGIDAQVVIPHYSFITGADYVGEYNIQRRNGTGTVYVHTLTADGGVPVYLLKSYPYFVDDGKLYTVWDWDTPRFIYFSQMVMGLTWALHSDAWGAGAWSSDLLHVHDWHTGLVPFLVHEARFNPFWQDLATVLSIHNMGYQGKHAGGWLWEQGFPNREHPALRYQDWRDNLLGIGIAYADKVNTVSPNHAVELHYPRFGEGLEELIWARDADFTGILNGIDTERYDPATDPHIRYHFTADDFRLHRPLNKTALQEEMGLPQEAHTPLMALVSRLTEQKGIDFTLPAVRHILATQDAQFIALGAGDPALESQLVALTYEFPHKARVYLGYNAGLAQRIYAGADLVLVPSRYEPCGLTQIFALRYGCLPLVRQTGGLVDTVQNYDNAEGGTGFMFLFEEVGAVIGTLEWALETYRTKPEAWHAMQERGLRHDWSWHASASQYIALYNAALARKRAWRQEKS